MAERIRTGRRRSWLGLTTVLVIAVVTRLAGAAAGCPGLCGERCVRSIDTLLGAVIGALAACFVLWVVAIEPVRSSADLRAVSIAMTLVFIDVVALWVLVRLITLTPEHPVSVPSADESGVIYLRHWARRPTYPRYSAWRPILLSQDR